MGPIINAGYTSPAYIFNQNKTGKEIFCKLTKEQKSFSHSKFSTQELEYHGNPGIGCAKC